MEGRTKHIDERIVRALRRPDDPSTPIGPSWMPEVGRDVTALGGVTVIVLVTGAVAGFLLLDRKYAATVFALAATAQRLRAQFRTESRCTSGPGRRSCCT